MILRYDFGEVLDLSKFQKQALHYINCMPSLTYHFCVSNYRLVAEINKSSDSLLDHHTVTFSLFSGNKDADGDIINHNIVVPLSDTRFKEVQEIVSLFTFDASKSDTIISNSAEKTVEKLSRLIRVLHKINKLKAFL